MTMSRRKKILIGCTVFLVLLVGGGIVHHYRVKGALKKYLAQLTASGEPIHWQELLTAHLDPQDNCASLVTSLYARLPQSGPLATNSPTGMQMIEPGKAMAGWAQPWVGELNTDYSNDWWQVLADYKSQQEVLAEFQQLIAKPALDYNLDFSQGFNLALAHLAPWKTCAQRLGAASDCELQLGNTRAATLYLRAMVALTRGTAQEPVLISQLVRMAVASIAGVATWDLLQAGGLEDDRLAALQEDWSKLEFLSSMEKALMMERCFSIETIERMRASTEEFNTLTTSLGTALGTGGPTAPSRDFFTWIRQMTHEGWDRTKSGLAEGAWRTSWSYTDELRMLQAQQAYLEVLRLAIRDGCASNAFKLYQQLKAEGRIQEDANSDSYWISGDVSALRTLFSEGVASYGKAWTRALAAEANTRLVVTAIAVERHRLRYGTYPETLQELVPQVIAVVPADPADGNPLRYQRLAKDQFLLYSIGEDLKDDGGDPNKADAHSPTITLSWRSGKDWVWPQPASASEVQSYWKQEIDKAFDHSTGRVLPSPKFVLDPNTARLTIDPESRDVGLGTPDTIQLSSDLKGLPEDAWSDLREQLVRKWTTEYFHKLTNTAYRTPAKGN